MKFPGVNKKATLIFFVILVSRYTVLGQSADEVKKIFTQAESYYLYEEYELANQLYLLIESPDNMNIKYKIGSCYLNIEGEKEKSVPYLEEAVKSASFDFNSSSYKEMKSPPEVYFSLAKAYMINGDFDKALTVLQNFVRIIKEAGTKGELENKDFIDQQLQACKNGIQYRQVPVSFGRELLNPDFSMGSINEKAVVSNDGNTIVYTERRGLENAIIFSKKVSGKWESPVEITTELMAGTDCSTTALNADGTILLLYKTDNYDGAIYSSEFVNGKWTPIKKLNKNINTKYYESHASFSADGSKLYFTSNREGGYGNLDIYVSEKLSSGEWGPAKNLGPEINSSFNEDNPFITANDSILFFSSEGHNSMGGFDNFKSVRSANGWKTASNLGFPINSADDDKFFYPFNNGRNAYYSMATGYKKKEIFYLDLEKREVDRPLLVDGKISLADTLEGNLNNVYVKFINKITGDTLYQCQPDPESGHYSMNLSSGLFRIVYSGEGYISCSVDTMLLSTLQGSMINLDVKLQKDSTKKEIPEPEKYEKIDLQAIPVVEAVDTSMLIVDVKVNDEGDKTINDSDILYYTVQVIALHKPVDASYFKYIDDIKILYNEFDKFYRYTTGQFQSKDAAYSHRSELIRKGYPKQIFVKKVSK